MLLQDLLAVAHGVERRRPRADGADAHAAQSAHHAADAGEPLEVLAERSESGASVCRVVSEYGMPYCVRLLQADILPQKLSRRYSMDIFGGGIRRGVHQHRHVQIGQAQRVGDGALVAEVRQRDDHAVDAVAVGAEQVGALARFGARLHRAELAVLRAEDHAARCRRR